jgi:hypothetical protein
MGMLIFEDSEGLKREIMEYEGPKTAKPTTPSLHYSTTPIILKLLISTS